MLDLFKELRYCFKIAMKNVEPDCRTGQFNLRNFVENEGLEVI